ncbi:MAG: hypothetical protein BWX80_03135 [Candidatus Hydrogenedentes bacterium ADurb.Bin101]|nr:MAG: hypothetical protein BWX80_03135 [Candidatus Hydrogenedentes bacterium ADurb.Bin101]
MRPQFLRGRFQGRFHLGEFYPYFSMVVFEFLFEFTGHHPVAGRHHRIHKDLAGHRLVHIGINFIPLGNTGDPFIPRLMIKVTFLIFKHVPQAHLGAQHGFVHSQAPLLFLQFNQRGIHHVFQNTLNRAVLVQILIAGSLAILPAPRPGGRVKLAPKFRFHYRHPAHRGNHIVHRRLTRIAAGRHAEHEYKGNADKNQDKKHDQASVFAHPILHERISVIWKA